jgi:uncharacterized protein (DUF1501 family)
MNLNRRIFLKQGAFALICAGGGPFLGPSFLRQAAMAAELGTTTASSRNKVLLCIFQRGAVDGLSMVVPYGDPDYAKVRPDIALGAPSVAAGANATIDLDGYFGLNPALASLAPLFKSGSLAAIQACGSPHASRSHFTSQDLMESGVDHPGSVQDGWLNRLMSSCPEDSANASAFRAVAMTPVTPRSLQGREESMAIGDLSTFGMTADNGPITLPTMSTAHAFESMYGSAVDTVLHGTAKESFDAMSMLKSTRAHPYAAANGAVYPANPFGKNLQQIAQLIKANVGVQIAFAEVDGWDTHAVQGNAKGALAGRLKPFGDALAAFHQDMGDKMADLTVVTMSEFGRTVKQNGNRGTDHGHGTCFFTMGGSVKGGKVYGDWPTLAVDKLFQQRDLAVTTDFRDVFGEICARHFNVPLADMGKLFPEYTVDPKNFRNFCVG